MINRQRLLKIWRHVITDIAEIYPFWFLIYVVFRVGGLFFESWTRLFDWSVFDIITAVGLIITAFGYRSAKKESRLLLKLESLSVLFCGLLILLALMFAVIKLGLGWGVVVGILVLIVMVIAKQRHLLIVLAGVSLVIAGLAAAAAYSKFAEEMANLWYVLLVSVGFFGVWDSTTDYRFKLKQTIMWISRQGKKLLIKQKRDILSK